MKKLGLICSIILVLFSFGMTIYETINIFKMNQKTISTSVESNCHVGNGVDDLPYECNNKYSFTYKDNVYYCMDYTSSAIKKDYSKNEDIFFSSSNPNDCVVGKKSKNIITIILLDAFSLIVAGVLIVTSKKNK